MIPFTPKQVVRYYRDNRKRFAPIHCGAFIVSEMPDGRVGICPWVNRIVAKSRRLDLNQTTGFLEQFNSLYNTEITDQEFRRFIRGYEGSWNYYPEDENTPEYKLGVECRKAVEKWEAKQ